MHRGTAFPTRAGLVVALSSSALFATDGYFSNGYGTQCRGLAGACTALSLDSLATASNPAGMLRAGRRFDLGIDFFAPRRDFTVNGAPSGLPGTFGLAPGTVKSDSPLFLLPSFGANFLRGTETSFGIGVYVNGGLNTNYPAPVFGKAPTGVDARQIFITPTLARRFARKHTFGIAPILAYQQFKAYGLGAFAAFSSNPANLSDNDRASALGAGVRFGYQGELANWLTVGAAYRSRTKMGKFDKYSGLFAEQGGFDIPSAYNFGIAIKPTPQLTLTSDIQRTHYSQVASVGNPLLPNLTGARLGDDSGPGFGWRDLTVGRFGVQVDASRNWTWRGGISVSGQTVPESEVLFNIVAPAVLRSHAAFGLTRRMGSRAFHLAVVRAFSASVTGANPLEVPGRQNIGLRMDQWEVEIGFTFGARR